MTSYKWSMNLNVEDEGVPGVAVGEDVDSAKSTVLNPAMFKNTEIKAPKRFRKWPILE